MLSGWGPNRARRLLDSGTSSTRSVSPITALPPSPPFAAPQFMTGDEVARTISPRPTASSEKSPRFGIVPANATKPHSDSPVENRGWQHFASSETAGGSLSSFGFLTREDLGAVPPPSATRSGPPRAF